MHRKPTPTERVFFIRNECANINDIVFNKLCTVVLQTCYEAFFYAFKHLKKQKFMRLDKFMQINTLK